MNNIYDHRHAHQLIEKYHGSENSLCVIVKNSKEARLLKNELCLYIDPSFIRYFPENEILPYDHFSIPENILKERFTILNTLNKNKDIVISKMDNKLRLVHPLNNDFFEACREKLGWSLDISKK